MLDINFIRNNPEKVKKGIGAKGYLVDIIDKLLDIDEARRKLLAEVDELRAKRNQAAEGKNIDEGKKIKAQLDGLEKKLSDIEKNWQELMFQVPNVALEGVSKGNETKNKILRSEGQPPKFNFTPKDHVELGEILGIIDIPRATKISGSRFAYLKNEGAILELALVQFAMETLIKEGFTPIIPPALIKKEITDGLGYWQEGGNENYYYVRDFEVEGKEKGQPLDLYLIGTGEHALVPMHSDEILEGKDLPKKYAAFSPCFRREAGSYGKDTRGIFRVHQFDKVEMVQLVKPEDDEEQRRKILSIAEGLMKSLGLSYQVVQLASGDLSFPAAETIDIETWIPSQNKYRETHSISTTTDFQARRLNIKFRAPNPGNMTLMGVGGGSRIEYVHILNGTAFAIGRTIIAILENFQTEDGSVKVPQVLQKYTGFAEIKPRA